jgi:hypothetical protein
MTQHPSLKRTGIALACVCLLLHLTGCATLNVVTAERLNRQSLTAEAPPVAHIYAANWGIYLFRFIPLITGNLNKPGVPRLPALFTHNVRVDLLVEKVTAESQRQGGTIITDLRTRDRSLWLPLTLIFWMVEFEVSGNASRLEGEGPAIVPRNPDGT